MPAESWIVEFEFKVAYQGSISGDGFAFWYTKDRAKSGPVFGSSDYFEGLGLFFDTYANSRERHSFPYVMAMIGDGTKTYNHDKDGVAQEFGGCSVEFRNRDFPTKARVTYIHKRSLKVELDVDNTEKWTLCFEKNENIKLPEKGYLGFSAMTGGVSSKHDIIYAQVYEAETKGVILIDLAHSS